MISDPVELVQEGDCCRLAVDAEVQLGSPNASENADDSAQVDVVDL